MTRIHALVVIFLLLTVVIHAALAGLLSLVSRRARGRRGPSSPPVVGPGEPIKTARHLGVDRAVSERRPDERRPRAAVYGTCAHCGLPISLTHATRRGLRRAATRDRAA